MTLVMAGWLQAWGAGAADPPRTGFLPDGHEHEFAVDADADTYTGPAPLTVHFTAHASHALGRTSWAWSFDDRGTSGDQHPIHTFRRPGWYAVTVDARDGAGPPERVNLLVHAWRARDWARLQHRRDLRIVRHGILELQRKNAQRAAAATAIASGSRVGAP